LCEDLLAQGRTVLVETHSMLQPREREILLQDFELCTQRIDSLMKLKFNFWSKLPWKLCGIGHWDTGSCCASRGIQRTNPPAPKSNVRPECILACAHAADPSSIP
jgi:hypothetical protein